MTPWKWRKPTRREREDARIQVAGIFINTRAAFILAHLRGRTKLGTVTITERGWICTCGIASTAMGWSTDTSQAEHDLVLRRHLLAAFVRRHKDCPS